MTLRIERTDNSGFSARSGKSFQIGTPICLMSQCRAVDCRAVDYCLVNQSRAVLIPAHQEGEGKQRHVSVSPGGFRTFSRPIPDFTPESQEQMLLKRAAGNSSAIAGGSRSTRFKRSRFQCAPGVDQSFDIGFSSSEFREDRSGHLPVVTVCCPQGTTQCF